jgi:hypothetical protein
VLELTTAPGYNLDADQLDGYTELRLLAGGTVINVTDQQLVSGGGTFNATAKGHTANTAAGTLNIESSNTGIIQANAQNLNLVVDGGTATVSGDVSEAEVALVDAADELILSTVGTLNRLTSLTITGEGKATITDDAGSELSVIELSVDGGADVIDLKNGASVGGASNAATYDSISNFDTSVDKLTIHDGATNTATAFADEGSITGNNLFNAIDAAFGTGDHAVVFEYDDNTYAYVDLNSDGDYNAADILVELVGTLDLDDLSSLSTLQLIA